MWYKHDIRRHLCDMHIDDWSPEFLTKFSPKEYVNNLKTAKIQNAMLYFQSHVGLCYYPTKSGKLHNGFAGSEDKMRKLTELCHKEGISVTGYYSLIYNTWAHDKYPEWRMVDKNGLSQREAGDSGASMAFSTAKAARYGLCCPNNPEYRKFVEEQIREMVDYFTVDGMFYDMLFWPHMCYCDSCKARWEKEVGGEIPVNEDWSDERWLLHMQKRREWMGEFAHWATNLTKTLLPNISVEHNAACSALPDGLSATAEEVISACDYTGGDLYGDRYSQSFTCKLYRNITKNQPFEYMFSRCAPNLSAHTQLKSPDILKSAAFITTAYHGATLVIDAIDPIGTMDSRVYKQLGEVFDEIIPYEPYLNGEMLEDLGIYYTHKSKFNPRKENWTNYLGTTTTVETMIYNNVLSGITGGFHDINKYKLIVAPCLTNEDSYDNERIINYVKNGGSLYFSGADNSGLLKEFFGAAASGRTEESIVYIAPNAKADGMFEYFTDKYPLHFEGTAPIIEGMDKENVIATITLPYTQQNTNKFASIHSNPPGIPTDIPAMAVTRYGKGTVLWSALPIECVDLYDYRRIFMNLLNIFLGFTSSLFSDAPDDVEITAFERDNSVQINTVLINTRHTARKVEDFTISFKTNKEPKNVVLMPESQEIPFEYSNNTVTFKSENMKIFNMYEIIF